MDHPSVTPEERYSELVAVLLGEPDVAHSADAGQPSKGFGASALKVRGKIFAMLVKGRLVVKLPRRRVDALIAAGDGARFDPGHGRLMKEWLSVEPTSAADWLLLAREAMAFVASKR